MNNEKRLRLHRYVTSIGSTSPEKDMLQAATSPSFSAALASVDYCWLSPRKQAVLIGGLLLFQTVIIVMVVIVAFSGHSSDTDTRRVKAAIPSAFNIFWLFDPPKPAPVKAKTNSLYDMFVNYTAADFSENLTSNRYTFGSELKSLHIEVQSVLFGADCVSLYLRHYDQFCRASLSTTTTTSATRVPFERLESVRDVFSAKSTEAFEQAEQDDRQCQCVPIDRLVGRINPLSKNLQPPIVLSNCSQSEDVRIGGHWSPPNCTARQRLAVIIPFRDRESHLCSFLRVVHPFLQRQLVDYSIFVVEQDEPHEIFNKASVMNAGFLEVRALSKRLTKLKDGSGGVDEPRPYDCYMFHDVDMLPEDDRNFYGCGAWLPRHVGAYLNKHNYSLAYNTIFGGATAFRPEVFELLNGYSNEFYGWGGEDDDMMKRIEARNMTFVRYPKCIATYSMIKHPKDKRNPYNSKSVVAFNLRPHVYKKNGLNSLRYKLVASERRPLYTWLLVSLPPPPPPKEVFPKEEVHATKGKT